MTSTSLVLMKRVGNHSNRLIQSLHFHAWCIHNKVTFYNNDFSDMANLYSEPPRKMPWLHFLQSGMKNTTSYNFTRDRLHDKNDEILSGIVRGKKLVMVRGFYFRSDDLVLKYRDSLISKYTLKNEFHFENHVTKEIEESNGIIFIGVHIRRGDYIKFRQGKYYYDDKLYQSWIRQLESQFSEKTRFILFSNEDISIEENDNISHCNEKWFIDQYVMSLCDFLIGPPSTFTRWASFMGHVPLKHVEYPDEDIRIEDFKIIQSP